MPFSILLPHSSDNDHAFFLAAAAVPVFLLVFMHDSKVYDLATAAWFAASIGFLARGQLFAYYLLFPIGCLNRETTFLMTLLFLQHFGRERWIGVLYQALVFVCIRIAVMTLYADQPGAAMLVRPVENWNQFISHPAWSLVHWLAFAALTCVLLWRWKSKPLLLRQALLVLGPSLMAMYLVLGVSFEIRVFAEIYPVVFALIGCPLEVNCR